MNRCLFSLLIFCCCPSSLPGFDLVSVAGDRKVEVTISGADCRPPDVRNRDDPFQIHTPMDGESCGFTTDSEGLIDGELLRELFRSEGLGHSGEYETALSLDTNGARDISVRAEVDLDLFRDFVGIDQGSVRHSFGWSVDRDRGTPNRSVSSFMSVKDVFVIDTSSTFEFGAREPHIYVAGLESGIEDIIGLDGRVSVLDHETNDLLLSQDIGSLSERRDRLVIPFADRLGDPVRVEIEMSGSIDFPSLPPRWESMRMYTFVGVFVPEPSCNLFWPTLALLCLARHSFLRGDVLST